jgi:uncharacterized coiled-coil DUF342 family protein
MRTKLEVVRDYSNAMERLKTAIEQADQARLDLAAAESSVEQLQKRADSFERELAELLRMSDACSCAVSNYVS